MSYLEWGEGTFHTSWNTDMANGEWWDRFHSPWLDKCERRMEFPRKDKNHTSWVSNAEQPSDVFGKKTWKAKWGMDRCDGQVRELKMERQRRGESVEQQRRQTETERERQGMWGRKKMEVRRERKRKREGKGRETEGGKQRWEAGWVFPWWYFRPFLHAEKPWC